MTSKTVLPLVDRAVQLYVTLKWTGYPWMERLGAVEGATMLPFPRPGGYVIVESSKAVVLDGDYLTYVLTSLSPEELMPEIRAHPRCAESSCWTPIVDAD